MKTLVLIRHGKSSWKHGDLEDFERPLNGRGRRDTPQMAERFSRLPYKPSLIISSYATRALTTARIFCGYLSYPLEQLRLMESVYEASLEDLVEVVGMLPDSHSTVAVFGHNPGFTDLVNHLCSSHLENLPSAGVAVITLPIQVWGQVSNGECAAQCELAYCTYPKQVS